MGQMNQAFRNIVNMLHGVRDGLIRDANHYESQEQASQQILSSSEVIEGRRPGAVTGHAAAPGHGHQRRRA